MCSRITSVGPQLSEIAYFWTEEWLFPWFSSNVLLLIRDDEISTHLIWDKIASFKEWNPESVSFCSAKERCPHIKKNSVFDVISVIFVHFIDRAVWHCTCRHSFSEDENIEKPQVPFDATEHKKGKRIVSHLIEHENWHCMGQIHIKIV